MIKKLIKNNKTIASIESFTGGAFIASLIKQPGASKVVKGSLVAYQSSVKEKFGIDISDGTISEKCCNSMLDIGDKLFSADITVSFTGNAGPNPDENKPVGQYYLGIKAKNFKEILLIESKENSREKIINEGNEKLCNLLESFLKKMD